MKIIKEGLMTDTALVGFPAAEGSMCIRVGADSDTGNQTEACLMLYNRRTSSADAKMIRLGFRENACYEHRNFPLWEPSEVPFEEVKEWLKEKSEYSRSLSNWQYAIMMWNRENEFVFTEEEFIDGTADKKYGNSKNPGYVLSTDAMPDWTSSAIVKK